MPGNYDAISLTDNWQDALVDPLVAQWQFVGAVTYDRTAMANLPLGPNTARFVEPSSALLRLTRLGELAGSKDLVGAYLIETPEAELPDDDPSKRPVITGLAIATPDTSLVHRDGRIGHWQNPDGYQDITRIELAVVGGDKFFKAAQLLGRVCADASSSFSEQPQVALLAASVHRQRQTDFGTLLGGVGEHLGFSHGSGYYAWSEKPPKIAREAQILASIPAIAPADR